MGVDLSAEAVRQARAQASRLARRAEFVVGALEATGLEPGSVDAAMCIDAVQLADPRRLRTRSCAGSSGPVDGWC
ncbi:MAG: Methyltransferase domain [Nocardioidaceae bacterium]|nr:Methyltransferase domain [Nocardioidaceae bacterium]